MKKISFQHGGNIYKGKENQFLNDNELHFFLELKGFPAQKTKTKKKTNINNLFCIT